MTAPAPQMTKEKWSEAFKLLQLRLTPYQLRQQGLIDALNLLAQLAHRANPALASQANPGEWANAMHVVLKSHYQDANPRLFFWEGEGSNDQSKVPPMVIKIFYPAKPWVYDEVVEAQEAEKAAKDAAIKKALDAAKAEIPRLIDSFAPHSVAIQARVQKTLQDYFDKCVAAEESGTKVNWKSVLARVEAEIDKEYTAAECRQPGYDRVGA